MDKEERTMHTLCSVDLFPHEDATIELVKLHGVTPALRFTTQAREGAPDPTQQQCRVLMSLMSADEWVLHAPEGAYRRVTTAHTMEATITRLTGEALPSVTFEVTNKAWVFDPMLVVLVLVEPADVRAVSSRESVT